MKKLILFLALFIIIGCENVTIDEVTTAVEENEELNQIIDDNIEVSEIEGDTDFFIGWWKCEGEGLKDTYINIFKLKLYKKPYIFIYNINGTKLYRGFIKELSKNHDKIILQADDWPESKKECTAHSKHPFVREKSYDCYGWDKFRYRVEGISNKEFDFTLSPIDDLSNDSFRINASLNILETKIDVDLIITRFEGEYPEVLLH